MKKICFVDLETTGLNPWKENDSDVDKGVVLSAGFVVNKDLEFEMLIRPTEEEWGYASKKALEVNGMTWDIVSKGLERNHAIGLIYTWLRLNNINDDNYVFFAQNSRFDKMFLNHLMGGWLDFVGAPSRWVDFIPIYEKYGKLLGLNVEKKNSHHISQQLGVEEEPKPHQAIEGARVLKRNYDKLKSLSEDAGHRWVW